MRIRWRNFELPSNVTVDQESVSSEYGKFIVEPFEKGFGHTIGNGLRRCLLSSIEGTAVVSVDIEGVDHEFTTMEGVLEDITEVVLNLKGLLIDLDQGDSMDLVASRDKVGELTAGDIDAPVGVVVLNPKHVICTLTDDVPVKMTIRVERGRGYVTAEEHESGERVLGVIAIDSNFSPVKRVRYKVEETRVGKMTNYDRLVLETWTDGTVRPEDALGEASKIFRKHLNAFVHHRDLASGVPSDMGGIEPVAAVEEDSERSALRETLSRPIDELDFSVRSRHCLDSENIQTIGDLVSRTEADLLKVRNFGKTSLTEIHKKLENLNLSLGMTGIDDLVN